LTDEVSQNRFRRFLRLLATSTDDLPLKTQMTTLCKYIIIIIITGIFRVA